jgi:hypothetical protein
MTEQHIRRVTASRVSYSAENSCITIATCETCQAFTYSLATKT